MFALSHKVAVLVLVCAMIACTEVRFRNSQPLEKGSLQVIPDDLLGRFVNDDGDTLILTPRTINVLNRESECNKLNELDSLSDHIMITAWKDYLFLNLLEDSLWSVALIERNEDVGFRLSLIDAEEPEIIDFISHITHLTTYLTDDDEPLVHVIDPSHDELQELISEKAFSIHYDFRRLPR